jgi:diguanylate cyclase (GGDEF)-like protein
VALFSALREIAPHLDAAMVLNVCEGAGLLVSIRDHEGRPLHYSDELVTRLQLGPDGARALRYFDERGRELAAAELPHERVRRSGQDVLNAVSRIEGPGGTAWVQMSFVALAPGEQGYSVLGIGSDITARREAERGLRRAATHDGLTGLLNRAGLRQRAEPAFERARRGAEPLAVALLDIDHFKAFNDRHGHAAGDAVLAAVARAIRETLPAEAAAARWGGEEFLVLFPGLTGAAAGASAEALCEAVATIRLALDEIDGAAPNGARAGERLRVTASLGVSALPGPAATLETLVAEADRALYAAKRGGRDRVAASVAGGPWRIEDEPARRVS